MKRVIAISAAVALVVATIAPASARPVQRTVNVQRAAPARIQSAPRGNRNVSRGNRVRTGARGNRGYGGGGEYYGGDADANAAALELFGIAAGALIGAAINHR